ncbi:hypothetical protein [uncultured Lacinutrix sp.]|uniref:hypothetical protein n=1 Tax=uncultured Lacinutrix sp. TaxID=574032 RepID=UPI002630295E|nr:hypothetical protein [uncultured Lacinutrix sp.]
MKVLKVVFFLLIVTSFSCDNDDDSCNDSDVPVNFNVKVKLISTTGENLFNDSNFDISLLKLSDPNSAIDNRVFSEITENGEALIEFDALNMSSVSFVYDGTEKFYFGFHDIQMETVDCNIHVVSYKARELNGDLICDCTTGEVIVVTL